jgi:DNA processing protein
MDEIELGYLMAVAAALVWTPRALRGWLDVLESPRAVVAWARDCREHPPCGAEPLREEALARLAHIDETAAAEALDAFRASGARLLRDGAEDYPSALRDLCDAPPLLYLRGDAAALRAGRSVAVVGSRAASAYGRTVAHSIAAELAAAGVCVVSGLARGIDAAAHKGALSTGGMTIAVVGSGLSALYPPYHALLADEIVANGGAVVSEFPPRMDARAHHFPMRNRIVAALAHATVVVEASRRSGALITARLADEIGRSVFAIPGDVGRPTSEGTNALIMDGVALITGADDVCRLMNWATPVHICNSKGDGANEGDSLIALLEPNGSAIEELSERAGMSIAAVSSRLMVLEIRGEVARLPGGLYAPAGQRPVRACSSA